MYRYLLRVDTHSTYLVYVCTQYFYIVQVHSTWSESRTSVAGRESTGYTHCREGKNSQQNEHRDVTLDAERERNFHWHVHRYIEYICTCTRYILCTTPHFYLRTCVCMYYVLVRDTWYLVLVYVHSMCMCDEREHTTECILILDKTRVREVRKRYTYMHSKYFTYIVPDRTHLVPCQVNSYRQYSQEAMHT